MKKIILTTLAGIMVMAAMSTVAFAAVPNPIMLNETFDNNQVSSSHCGSSTGYSFMMDEDGNFLSQEDFEEKLDKAIKDGIIADSDKEYYLNMFERCTSGDGVIDSKSNKSRSSSCARR